MKLSLKWMILKCFSLPRENNNYLPGNLFLLVPFGEAVSKEIKGFASFQDPGRDRSGRPDPIPVMIRERESLTGASFG